MSLSSIILYTYEAKFSWIHLPAKMELVSMLKFHPAYISKSHNGIHDGCSFEVELTSVQENLANPRGANPAISTLLAYEVIQLSSEPVHLKSLYNHEYHTSTCDFSHDKFV